jgi:hypothetical protein
VLLEVNDVPLRSEDTPMAQLFKAIDPLKSFSLTVLKRYPPNTLHSLHDKFVKSNAIHVPLETLITYFVDQSTVPERLGCIYI